MGSDFKFAFSLAAGLTASIAATNANAAINYGDYSGTTVDYIGVFEDDTALFGTPTITGDTLSFSPAEFAAQSSGGESNSANPGPVELIDGTLGFDLVAKPGEAIQSFTLEESGAFALVGAGTEFTQVQVAVVFSVNILEVDGVAYNGPSQVVSNTTLLSENLVSSPGLGQSWSGQAEINIAALAADLDPAIVGDITKARVSLDNQLLAISEDGSVAFVDKKNIDGVVITIPEPSMVAVLGLGGLALLGRRRQA